MQAIGYVRISREEENRNGASIGAQREAIAVECQRRGWELVEVIEDRGYSARDLKRPGIQAALEAVKAGRADSLVVAKLDRLSRSVHDFTAIMAKAQRESWGLVALDCAVDTTTPAGEAMANVLATFAQFERRLIGQRTKEALAEKRRQGVKLGRPRRLPAKVVRRVVREREAGKSLQAIADGLNSSRIPTAQGGQRWYPSTIRAVLSSAAINGERGRTATQSQ